MAVCKRCIERGKTWNGGDPKCAFESGVFDTDNWMCATMNALRDKAEDNRVYNNEQSGALLPDGEGSYIVLSWYKNRGRTEGAWVFDESDIEPLTLENAEALLDGKEMTTEYKRKQWEAWEQHLAATSAHGTEPSDSEPKASSTVEDGRSQEAADGGKAVMEGKE
jgi:hypothetical protein